MFSKKSIILFFALFYSLVFIATVFAQETKLVKRIMTDSEFKKFKNSIGTFQEGKNYNEIYNGHGTGLIPPTEEQWIEMKNQPLLVDKIDFPSGIAKSLVSHDNSATIWFPPVGNQGNEGSCVAWACVYYTKTFQEAREHNWDLSGCVWTGECPSAAYQDKIFSPCFIYHQLNNEVNEGSGMIDNMELLERIGCCTWDRMPYDPTTFTSWPCEDAWRQAPLYRSKTGYGIMFVNSDSCIENLKQLLVNGNLAIILIDVGNYSNFTTGDLWTLDNYSPNIANHANTIVGYDDNYGPFTESGNSNKYGAFKVTNSWGVGGWEHTADGFYYISYECMKQRIQNIHLYQNTIDYKPKIAAVFELNQALRGSNMIHFGIGAPNSPYVLKPFRKYVYSGSIPYPNHKMLVDVTEFSPYMSGSTDQFFIRVYNEGPTGTLQHFSIEMYDDYASGIPKNVYASTETPLSIPQYNITYSNVFTPAGSITITYPTGGEVFEVGSNPTITYTSVGNSGQINLDYSTDGGVTWDTIATNTEDDGDWTQWIVPNTFSTNCKIRISDADGYPSVISSGLFTIQSSGTTPNITLQPINQTITEGQTVMLQGKRYY